ncbi:helix-turn-helix transcriptional regulator [Acinetobacter baumannii]|uniref:helix-turn-helix transcriptional regulator n=1 Tax=Acinetobacter baumannii TaxID=470 RepID=UPI001F4466CA|nr:AlpA family phage regulatory protein [Acinetobacter baumannii]MDO7394682.1 AlpA family phage regulatory protein [Acinetobacter baumannii]UJX48801.1 AlpA family phage regulatory protein [Acinetobacter baumannii]
MEERQNRLLDLKAVELKTSLPKSTIYDWMKTGYFPSSMLFGEGKRKIARWLESDIDCWIEKHRMAS